MAGLNPAMPVWRLRPQQRANMAKKRKRKLRKKKARARAAPTGRPSSKAIRNAAGTNRKKRGNKTARAKGVNRKKKPPARNVTGKNKLARRTSPPKRRSKTRAENSIIPKNLHKQSSLRFKKTKERKALGQRRVTASKTEHEVSPQKTSKPFYITTAIAYPNGPPHMGYAYEVIATDAIARFMRLDGYDVFFLTGTDEHGQKIQQTATKEGLSPQELLDRNSPRFRAMAERFGCSNDDFIRTTEERHRRSSVAIWERMAQADDIYLDNYVGWYSVRDEAYYDEDETHLDDNGVRVGPQGTPVEWVEEESYFFRLSAYQDKLLDWYENHPNFVLPQTRMNEVASFVRGGLRDLSISRTTFDWGVNVPGNPKHVIYVWVDALTNYITAVGFPDTKGEKFRRYWPAALHVIGKDIVRFHAVYWPAFLMSARLELPKRIFSHGWILNRGVKMSKSVGNVVDPFALADTYGVDQLRYFFLREVSFGQDGNYSHQAIVNRINADLANDLGNLAQRSLTMVARAFGGVLPKPQGYSAADQAILGAADAMVGKAREEMATQQLHQVLNAVWAVVADANRYFAGEAPWALAKTDPARQGTILYVTAEVLRQISILALPFMPAAAGKLLDLLAVPAAERVFSFLGGEHRIAAGAKLPAPAPVFPRYVEPGASAAQ
jgi:methionyl-tRNA synthetase